MIRRVAKVAWWLMISSGVLAGLYWLFLITPESNALTLTASALLVFGMIAVLAVAANSALLLAQDNSLNSAARISISKLYWAIVAAIPMILIWILAGQLEVWIARHEGEIHAWFIARLGWADVRPLFRAELWVSRWLRCVLAPVFSLCLLRELLQSGTIALRSTRWLRHAFNWRTLTLSTLIVFVLLLWPWQLTMWRPTLPPSSIEVVVAGFRLATVAMLAVLGSALLISLVVRQREG